jgi:Zn-finger nucleic acid-binding protein
MELTCPKCTASMRNYERNGIQIDQCTGCKGVFLDRGELEHLIDGEDNYYRPPTQSAPSYSQPQQSHYPKKKKNFLSEILDF